jgi:hypothetical protein
VAGREEEDSECRVTIAGWAGDDDDDMEVWGWEQIVEIATVNDGV